MSATQSILALNSTVAGALEHSHVSTSARIQRLNRLLELAWDRGWSSRPILDANEIFRAGTAGATPLKFVDHAEWTERLESLTSALRDEARLNPLGLTIAYGQLVRLVRQRMKLELLWQKHPEILQLPVPPPIIVLGHMRAGTTRMQRMLASDDRFSATRFCDSWHPMPPRGVDWRPAKAWAVLQLIGLLNPQFASIHPTSATATDEEIGWLGLGFSNTPFDAQWHIPSFVAANNRMDASSTYRLIKLLIQTQQWHERGRARPRVLKVPQFMEDIDALLSVFPEARILHVTRDPLAVVASSCSLVANQRALQSDDVDLAEIGREWLNRTVEREVIAGDRLASHNFPVAKISYDEMEGDWRTAMTRVYNDLGLSGKDNVFNGMERFQSNPKTRHGRHHYRLEDFGLTARMVGAAFEHRQSKKAAPPLREHSL